jgi:protein-L-isoaspartate(D-aspartate) O-methyltransferase
MCFTGVCFVSSAEAQTISSNQVTNVAVYPCDGCGRNPGCEAALAAAIESDIESGTEGWRRVTRLYRGTEVNEERCWLRAPGWSLAFE